MIPAGTAYTDAEDVKLIQLVRHGADYAEMSAALDREPRSVRARIGVLRRKGIIPRPSVPPKTSLPEGKVVSMTTPPLVLANDDRLVERCLRAGGFPRAVSINGLTYWLNHEDRQWRAADVLQRKAA